MHRVQLGSWEVVRMRGLMLLLATALAAGCTSAPDDPPLATDVMVFEGARILTGDGTVIEDGVLVVQRDRVVQVGRAGEIEAPAGATRVYLTGKTVMPAIVDTHTHMAAERDQLLDQLQRQAYWGVGAVASLGMDNIELAREVRDEVISDAARLRTAGHGITTPEPGRSEVPYWVTTPEEARAAVQELAKHEVDIVKIWVDDRNGQYKKLSPELYGPIIEEAHAHGLRVTAHIFNLEDAKGLLRAGLDAFAHGVRDVEVDDELLTLLRERPHVVLVPNLPGRGVAEDLSWIADTVPPADVARMQEAQSKLPPTAGASFQLQARNLVAMKDGGVRIGFGTDTNGGWQAHQEMADMVAAGMSPAEVIVAATQNAAALLQIEDLGTLAPGKSADFIVLDANPLDDITNTRRIASVYLRGAEIDRAALRARWANGGTN
jgi:imidazolonepropionase-like amidohydrolase